MRSAAEVPLVESGAGISEQASFYQKAVHGPNLSPRCAGQVTGYASRRGQGSRHGDHGGSVPQGLAADPAEGRPSSVARRRRLQLSPLSHALVVSVDTRPALTSP
jgi:hypothetical protein